jgi:photosystem II stability/assembly factor-like uncharacterized protein
MGNLLQSLLPMRLSYRQFTPVLFFMLVFIQVSCKNSAIKINMRGPVSNGGRAVAVTIDPTNNNNVWVASATGGLYNSRDGGAHWTHVDQLPEFGFSDVMFAPSDPNTIIATCIEDTRKSNGGGIWLSTDAGASWMQPPGSRLYEPRTGKKQPLITKRYSAYGISFMPFTQRVFVGTDYGLAVSDDLGRHWQYIQPSGNTPEQFDRVYSVLAQRSGRVIVSGENGIFTSNNGKNGWTPDAGGYVNDAYAKNSLASLPGNEDILFFTGDKDIELMYKPPSASTWRDIDLTTFKKFKGINAAGRRPYVKIIRAEFTNNEYFVYYSHLDALGVLRVKWTGSDIAVVKDWQQVGMQHVDQADLAFASFRIEGVGTFTVPMYATNDGGVEKSTDNGSTWKQVGNVNNDFNALQVYDLISVRRLNDADKQLDIYFGTQDNGFYGSVNSGLTWIYHYLPEGGNLQGSVEKRGNDATFGVAWLNVSGGFYEKYLPASDAALPIVYPFQPRKEWEHNALYYLGVNTYAGIGTDKSNVQQIYLTNDNASSWRLLFRPQHPLLLYSFFSGDLSAIATNRSTDACIYAAYSPTIRTSRTGDPGNGGLNSMVRIEGLFNQVVGDEKEEPVPLPPDCVMGSYGSVWRREIASFGVDPKDPGFIIVPDIHNNTIHITPDSGKNWARRDDLVNLITDNGKFLFALTDSFREDFELASNQVSCIRFDPANSKNIAIGTAEAGVVLSTDHGATWKKISHSEKIGNITDISFNNGKMYVSSWGCGIWCISID